VAGGIPERITVRLAWTGTRSARRYPPCQPFYLTYAELGLGKAAPLDTPNNALRRLQKDELVVKLEYGHYQNGGGRSSVRASICQTLPPSGKLRVCGTGSFHCGYAALYPSCLQGRAGAPYHSELAMTSRKATSEYLELLSSLPELHLNRTQCDITLLRKRPSADNSPCCAPVVMQARFHQLPGRRVDPGATQWFVESSHSEAEIGIGCLIEDWGCNRYRHAHSSSGRRGSRVPDQASRRVGGGIVAPWRQLARLKPNTRLAKTERSPR
jgi:hypothetical protein